MGEPNSRSDQVNVLCSLAKDTLPSVSDSPPRCMCIHKPGELLGAGGGGGVLAMYWYPIQGGVVIRVVASC